VLIGTFMVISGALYNRFLKVRRNIIEESYEVDTEKDLLILDWEVSRKSAISMIGGGIFLIAIYIIQIISKCF